MYEVEQKYPLADVPAVEAALARLGATWHRTAAQVDRYFNHPSRDFAVTDEALRLRRTDDTLAITWKGPRLDATAKTRRELELMLAQAAVPAAAGTEAAVPAAAGEPAVQAALDRWTELLEALGFRQVREVAKRRRLATIVWQGAAIEIAIDHVAGLGDFVELELQADAAGIAAAAARVESLALQLGCTNPERRSYLEMLLAAG
ncbi:MAG: class IV adenylate cyclase [Planctomycetes bacterium]|nr:class IV adenylate cyclase [Planctomycetota bacterium]